MVRTQAVAGRIVVLLLLTMGLCLAPARSEAAGPRTVDFSPGAAEQLFAIPGAAWANINEFVFLLCMDEPGANTMLRAQARQLSGYAEFDAACRVWGTTTFPALQKLAAELAQRDITELLLRLQFALKHLRDAPGTGHAAFDQIADSLNAKLVALAELGAQVDRQWKTLYQASNSIITEYHRNYPPQAVYIRIGPRLEDVKLAVELSVGRWNVLAANLQSLRTTLALPAGSIGIPELYDLDIEVGMAAWDEIAQRSKVFLADAPAYAKYLTGRNYDEACGLQAEGWHVLRLPYNGFVLAARDAGEASPAEVAMAQQVWEGHPDVWGRPTPLWSQQWKFSRLGNGWWSIENRARASGSGAATKFLLDSTPRMGAAKISGNPEGRNVWWRCLPITTSGGKIWFRLVNAALGEMRSLDILPNAAVMSPSSGVNGQRFQSVVVPE